MLFVRVKKKYNIRCTILCNIIAPQLQFRVFSDTLTFGEISNNNVLHYVYSRYDNPRDIIMRVISEFPRDGGYTLCRDPTTHGGTRNL